MRFEAKVLIEVDGEPTVEEVRAYCMEAFQLEFNNEEEGELEGAPVVAYGIDWESLKAS